MTKYFISNALCQYLNKNAFDSTFKERQIKRMSKRLFLIFGKQKDYILKNLTRAGFERNNLQTNTIQQIEIVIDGLPHKKSLISTILGFMKSSFRRGSKQIDKKLKLGIDFTQVNEEAVSFLKKKEKFELSNAKGNITDTTKIRLKAILVQSIEEGWSYNRTSEAIEDLSEAGVFSPARAQLIAVRENAVAYGTGRFDTIKVFVKENPDRPMIKKWLTVNDDRVTKTHRTNQSDGWIAYDKIFSGTGDLHSPGSDNPRCRCTEEYQVKRN